MLNIAIIEDHKALREIFEDHLLGDGYSVFSGFSAEDLDGYFASNRADVLILDLNLPGEDGLSITKRYRQAYPAIQIILLTVRAEAKDKIVGYDSGADLYLPKPISAEELSAAVNSVKRRLLKDGAYQDVVKLDLLRKMLIRHNMKVKLGSAEALILKGLIEAPNRSLEYWQILELLSLDVTEKNKGNLGVYIHRLNKKLSEVGVPEPSIQSLWKLGYQLTESMVISE